MANRWLVPQPIRAARSSFVSHDLPKAIKTIVRNGYGLTNILTLFYTKRT